MSVAFTVIRSLACKDENGFMRSIPKGIWNSPAFPRIFHPVILISSPCLRVGLRVISDGVPAPNEEIVIFWKYGETLTENVREAGVWSTVVLSFERTKNVYSFGPTGRVRVLVLGVVTHAVSMPWSLLSKSIDPPVSEGLMDPVNSKVTLVFVTSSFSLGPVVIEVSSIKEGEDGVGGFWKVEGVGACFCAC